MRTPPPTSHRTDPCFPYTTLCRAERRMVEEELETIIDTIRATQPDSTLARIDSAVQRFQLLQQQQREQFVDREMELTVASNALISNMLSIQIGRAHV